MTRVELATQLLRIRTLITLACVAAVPIIGGLATASHAGHRDGTQGGLFGAAKEPEKVHHQEVSNHARPAI